MKRDKRADVALSLATRVEAVAWSEGKRIYSVPSQSTPESHLVEFWPGTGTARCSCICGQYGKHGCVHVAAVWLARRYWRRAAQQQAEARERAARRAIVPVALRAEACWRKRASKKAA